MKSPELLSTGQQDAITHIYENDGAYLIGQMGSGKSVTALTAAAELLAAGAVRRVLIVAPLRVCNDVWRQEHNSWSHLRHLKVSIATGAEKARINAIGGADFNVVVINFENLVWFFKRYGADHNFDMLIIDEVTKIKAGGAGFKAMRKHIKDFLVRVVMTGTPVAESWADLFYCMFACDGGARLGRNKQTFLMKYFYSTDYEQRKWDIRPECINALTALISDVVVVLPDYTDELPALLEQTVYVHLNERAREYYDIFEADSVTDDVTADSAAIQVGKLQQIASGFIYTDDGRTVALCDSKIVRARTLSHVEQAQGRAVVYVYQFREELERLARAFPLGRQLGVSGADDAATLAHWRAGALPALFLHPKSAGHGLDLTTGATMIIMSPIWSRDLMRQVIARIWRRNQSEECRVYVLCARDTLDTEIVSREAGKGTHHDLLMSRLSAKRRR